MALIENLQTKTNIILNSPIYDIKCRYFNSTTGCFFGEYCHYKHVTNDPPQTPYQTLIQYQVMTNKLLQELLTMLTTIIKLYSVPQSKSQSAISTTSKPKSTEKSVKSKRKKKQKQQTKIMRSNLFAAAIQRTPTPPVSTKAESNHTKQDETPTAKYFESSQQSSHIITETQEKALFTEWVVKYISNDELDEETLDDVITHALYDGIIYNDIITGNKCVLTIESMLQSRNIKYRKLLNMNNATDE